MIRCHLAEVVCGAVDDTKIAVHASQDHGVASKDAAKWLHSWFCIDTMIWCALIQPIGRF